jgi:hypothetical protein
VVGEFGGCGVADSDSTLRKRFLNISMVEIESVVETDCVAYDVRRKSVKRIGIHGPILSSSVSLFVATLFWATLK